MQNEYKILIFVSSRKRNRCSTQTLISEECPPIETLKESKVTMRFTLVYVLKLIKSPL